jgi:hypothetical protein
VKFAAVTEGRVTPGESGPKAEMLPKFKLACDDPVFPSVTPLGFVSKTSAIPFLLIKVALMVPLAVGACANAAVEASMIAAVARIRRAVLCRVFMVKKPNSLSPKT